MSAKCHPRFTVAQNKILHSQNPLLCSKGLQKWPQDRQQTVLRSPAESLTFGELNGNPHKTLRRSKNLRGWLGATKQKDPHPVRGSHPRPSPLPRAMQLLCMRSQPELELQYSGFCRPVMSLLWKQDGKGTPHKIWGGWRCLSCFNGYSRKNETHVFVVG